MTDRRRALEVLHDVTEQGAYANLRLKEVREGNLPFISALVYTSLEHLSHIDYLLSHYVKGKCKPILRSILRLGVCQLLFLDIPDRAACDESVKLCREIGKAPLAGFVNGVLRNLSRDKAAETLPALPKEPLKRLSILTGYPEFLIKAYVGRYGEAFTEEMLSFRLTGTSLRAQWPYSTEELKKALTERGLSYTEGRLSPHTLRVEDFGDPGADPLFQAGKISVQSESALYLCEQMGMEKGAKILDACAAPGGKSAALSSLLEGTGEILSWELHPHRAELIKKTFARLGVKNASVEVRDATLQDPALLEQFDGVLLDVPCSGLGVTGKPDLRLQKAKEDILSLAKIQKQILESCCLYVKPGGVLLYATCTVSEAENEAQIRDFLASHPRFALEKEQQLFPHIHHSEGFYFAKLRRLK